MYNKTRVYTNLLHYRITLHLYGVALTYLVLKIFSTFCDKSNNNRPYSCCNASKKERQNSSHTFKS